MGILEALGRGASSAYGALPSLGAVGEFAGSALAEYGSEEAVRRRQQRKDSNFVAEYQRVRNDPAELRSLLDNAEYNDVSADVRQRVMTSADQQLARLTTADRQAERDRQAVARERGRVGQEAAKLTAEGYAVDVDPGGGPSREALYEQNPGLGILESFESNIGQDVEGRGREHLGVGLDSPYSQITSVERGPELEKQFQAETEQAEATLKATQARTRYTEAQIAVIENKIAKEEDFTANVDRAFRSVVTSGNTDLKNLAPEVRQQVQIMLNEIGLSGARERGEPVAFIKQRGEIRSAMGELTRLRALLLANKDLTGPLDSVISRLISPARRALLQSHVDRVRQRVGKALEGGVLRKEDEEKYKKILATLWDFDSVGIGKIDGLIFTLREDESILAAAWEEAKTVHKSSGLDPDVNGEAFMNLAIERGLIQEDRFFKEMTITPDGRLTIGGY